MKRHNVILESSLEPKDKNVLWLHGKKLKKFGKTGWEDIGNEALALGAFYGYFPDPASLPTDVTTPGYAYVGLDNPYKIWKFNGESWSDSGTSIDMNDADEEDITRNSEGKLQFKDRAYGNGMGYIILRTGKTFEEQVNKANTIYEIRYSFDIVGKVSLKEGCVLKFTGGKLSNGHLDGKGTLIDAACNDFIFDNVELGGDFSNGCYVDWFGAKPHLNVNDELIYNSSEGIQKAFDSPFMEVKFNNGIYLVNETVVLKKPKQIAMVGSKSATLRSRYGIAYNSNILASTVLTTTNNIDIIHVAIEPQRNSITNNKFWFKISGGTIDLSRMYDYSTRTSLWDKTAIKVIAVKDTLLWDCVLDVDIAGPMSSVESSYFELVRDTSGTGIEFVPDNNGMNYIFTINGRIDGFTYGVKNTMEPHNFNSLVIHSNMEKCGTFVDFNGGGNRGYIDGTIQPSYMYLESELADFPVFKNLPIRYTINSVVWDTNNNITSATGNIVWTNRFIINNKSLYNEIVFGPNCKNRIAKDTTGFITGIADDKSTAITDVQTGNISNNNFISYLHNDLMGLDKENYKIEYEGCRESGFWNNPLSGEVKPFIANGISVKGQNSDNGGTVRIYAITPTQISTLFIKLSGNYQKKNNTFKKIVISTIEATTLDEVIEKYRSNDLYRHFEYDLDTDNTTDTAGQISLLTYLKEQFENKFKSSVRGLVIEFLDFTYRNTSRSEIFIEGCYASRLSNSHPYSHIGNCNYTRITGDFILDDIKVNRVKSSDGNILFTLTDRVSGARIGNIYTTGYRPIYYGIQDILNSIEKNSHLFGEGARFSCSINGKTRTYFWTKKNGGQLLTSDGNDARAEHSGETALRPNKSYTIMPGFFYYDTTLNKPIWWTGTTWIDANGNNV